MPKLGSVWEDKLVPEIPASEDFSEFPPSDDLSTVGSVSENQDSGNTSDAERSDREKKGEELKLVEQASPAVLRFAPPPPLSETKPEVSATNPPHCFKPPPTLPPRPPTTRKPPSEVCPQPLQRVTGSVTSWEDVRRRVIQVKQKRDLSQHIEDAFRSFDSSSAALDSIRSVEGKWVSLCEAVRNVRECVRAKADFHDAVLIRKECLVAFRSAMANIDSVLEENSSLETEEGLYRDFPEDSRDDFTKISAWIEDANERDESWLDDWSHVRFSACYAFDQIVEAMQSELSSQADLFFSTDVRLQPSHPSSMWKDLNEAGEAEESACLPDGLKDLDCALVLGYLNSATRGGGENEHIQRKIDVLRHHFAGIEGYTEDVPDVSVLTSIKTELKKLKKEYKKLEAEEDSDSEAESDTNVKEKMEKLEKKDVLKMKMREKIKERFVAFAKFLDLKNKLYPELDLPLKNDAVAAELAPLFCPERTRSMYVIEEQKTKCRVSRAMFGSNECALKMFESTHLMLEEAKFQHRMKDKSVVPITAIFTCAESKNSYIEMPYYKENMASLEGSNISSDHARRLAVGCLAAVVHLHRNDIAHGDLKPANFLLSDDGLPILCDFGLSRKTQDQTMQTVTKQIGGPGGTLGYMAPELLQGDGGIKQNKDSDMYSVGKIFQWLVNNCQERTTTRDELTPFAEKLMHRDPSKRLSAMDCLLKLSTTIVVRDLVPSTWVSKVEGLFPERFDASDAEIHMCRKLLLNVTHRGYHHEGDGCSKLYLEKAKIVRVERNENHILFKAYQQEKERMMARDRTNTPGMEISQDFLIDGEVSEAYMMHGTVSSTINHILDNGLDEKESNLGAWYGSGVYFTGQSCKALQYCDRPHIHPSINPPIRGKEYTMIVCRVLLGNQQITDEILFCPGEKRKVVRKPNAGYDCIVALPGNKKMRNGELKRQQHEEVVIFNNYQIYPEFSLTFVIP